MMAVFDIKDIGNLKYFLGIEFNYFSDNEIVLNQKKYIKKLLKKFSMEDCNPVKTPMDLNIKINKTMCAQNEKERENLKNIPYRNLIGGLLYLAMTTRPDIAFSVNVLSRYTNNFGKTHWTSAKRILRYLKQTIDYGLHFKKSNEDIEGYADSDWASNEDDRRSYSGYVFVLSGSCISWDVKRQKTVALSSAEAEYMSLSEATKEAIYLKNLLYELKVRLNHPVKINNDSKSAQLMAKNPIINNRSKHIDICHHFVREAVIEGKVELQYLNTDSMPAAMLTKQLPLPKFNNCLKLLNLYIS